MYAIIKTGGKQYRVKEGDIIKVEKIKGKPGDIITFDDVLLIKKEESTIVGTPKIESAKVEAKIISQERDKKILIYKYTHRKGFSKRRGHRQSFSQLKVEKIIS